MFPYWTNSRWLPVRFSIISWSRDFCLGWVWKKLIRSIALLTIFVVASWVRLFPASKFSWCAKQGKNCKLGNMLSNFRLAATFGFAESVIIELNVDFFDPFWSVSMTSLISCFNSRAITISFSPSTVTSSNLLASIVDFPFCSDRSTAQMPNYFRWPGVTHPYMLKDI